MGLPTTTRQNKQRRKAPYPNSILDRAALIESLEESGISIKNVHLDTFYQALHRQQYPPLTQFVENYYKLERNELIETKDSGKLTVNKGPSRKHRNRRHECVAALDMNEITIMSKDRLEQAGSEIEVAFGRPGPHPSHRNAGHYFR